MEGELSDLQTVILCGEVTILILKEAVRRDAMEKADGVLTSSLRFLSSRLSLLTCELLIFRPSRGEGQWMKYTLGCSLFDSQLFHFSNKI